MLAFGNSLCICCDLFDPLFESVKTIRDCSDVTLREGMRAHRAQELASEVKEREWKSQPAQCNQAEGYDQSNYRKHQDAGHRHFAI